MAILLTLAGISLLIVLHEAGHFWVARACRMRVLRFSVGFGPALVQRRRGATVYQLAAVPLGGYVAIDGMGGADDDAAGAPPPAPADGAHTYGSRPAWQRALVIFAGPAANWLVCAALLVAVALGGGLTEVQTAPARLGELQADAAAAAAGLREGDVVTHVDGAAVPSWEALVAAVRAHPGQALRLDVARGGAALQLTVTPTPIPGPGAAQGRIGASPYAARTPLPAGAAVGAGLAATWRLTEAQAHLLVGAFTGGSARLSGLPGIVKVVSRQAEQSLMRLAEALAQLSIGLCLLNLLPVPGLDGSRLLLLAVEVVRRRPLDERIEGLLHTAGFVALLGLMLWVSVRDLL